MRAGAESASDEDLARLSRDHDAMPPPYARMLDAPSPPPPLLADFPLTAAALGYEAYDGPDFSEDDDVSDDGRVFEKPPGRFGRPSESDGWSEDEAAVRDAIAPRLGEAARRLLEGDDLLFLRLVRGFAMLEDRADATLPIVEEVCELRARYAATPAPPLGGGLAPPDFHEAIWPTWVCGRDAWGHLVVVERLGRVDFDRLLAMPVDAILRLRMDALDALQRRSARPRPGRPRVYKCVFLVDCRDCSYVDVARRETVRVTAAYARLTERMYADAVWKNVIVHAPAVLRATWSLVDPLLDPETRELIAFVGPEDVGAAGVPRRARWPD